MKELLKYLADFWDATQENLGAVAECVAAAGRAYLRSLIRLALIIFLFPIPILIFGIVLNMGWLVSIAGMFWSLATLLFLLSATPLGILFEVILRGRKGSGKRYVNVVLGTLLIELTFTLFVAIVPIGNNWRAIPIVLVASAVLGILAAQGMRTIFTKRLLGMITSCVLILFVASFAFPRSFSAFQDLFPWVDEQLAAIVSPEQRAARRLAEARREAELQEAVRQTELRREQERQETERQVVARREAERQAELRRETEQREAERQAEARREAERRGTAVYPISVNYGMSVEELIRLGHYDWASGDITTKNFQTTRIGTAEVIVELIHFNRQISTNDALRELDRMGYRPAELHELLVFGERYPDIQRRFPILALGSIWEHLFGSLHFPRLCASGSDRHMDQFMHLPNMQNNWPGYYRFAAVRK